MNKFQRLWLWFQLWLYKNLNGYGKISVRVLYAQILHETGDLKSEVYRQNKNLFGMRHPKVRETRSQGSNLAHAVYKTHKDSIVDYFLRQKHFEIPNVPDDDYMKRTLDSNYAEDPNYLGKWQWWHTNLPLPVNNLWLYAVGFFFVVAGFVFLIKNSNKKTVEK